MFSYMNCISLLVLRAYLHLMPYGCAGNRHLLREFHPIQHVVCILQCTSLTNICLIKWHFNLSHICILISLMLIPWWFVKSSLLQGIEIPRGSAYLGSFSMWNPMGLLQNDICVIYAYMSCKNNRTMYI